MIKGTCMRPQQRADKIMNNIATLKFESNEYMKAFKLEVDKEMAVVPARVLQAPKIQYANNAMCTPSFGGWKLDQSRKMYAGSKLQSWGVLVYESEHRFAKAIVESFLRNLTSTLIENGLQVPCRNPPIMYAQGNQVERNVDAIWSTIQGTCGSPPQSKLSFDFFLYTQL